MIDAHRFSIQPYIPTPAEGSARFHGHSGTNTIGQDTLLILFALLFEKLKGRNGNDPGGVSLYRQPIGGFEQQLHLAAAAHEDHIRRTFGLPQDVGTLQCVQAAALQLGQVLPGQRQAGGSFVLQGRQISGSSLPAVGRTEYQRIGHGSKHGQLLNGLVSGAILSHADGIMGKYIQHRQLHNGRKPQGRLDIVAEHEEGGAEDPQPSVQRHTIASAGHSQFPHTEMDVPSLIAAGLHERKSLELCLSGGSQICAAAQQVGHAGRQTIKHRTAAAAGSFAGGEFPVSRILRKIRQLSFPLRFIPGCQFRICLLVTGK